MVKRDPDDVISGLSKHMKANKKSIVRITFKRGGLWQPEFAKAHSRVAKKQIRQKLKLQCAESDVEYPLLVRFKENTKNKLEDERTRLNAQTKVGRGQNFIDSLLGVFRVNFFNKKNQQQEKQQVQITKANPESKTSIKKAQKKAQNRDRKLKRKQITKRQKREKVREKQAALQKDTKN